jgi:uncharacterized repeat protein (TIGR04138 family)
MRDRLQDQLEDLAQEDRRYPPDAYLLVFEGLEAALARLTARRHVTPAELVAGVRDAAVDQFGLMARAVLESWNMRSGGAVGDLVFNLIQRGLLEAGEDDTREKFENAYELNEGLGEAFLESLERDPPRLVARGA